MGDFALAGASAPRLHSSEIDSFNNTSSKLDNLAEDSPHALRPVLLLPYTSIYPCNHTPETSAHPNDVVSVHVGDIVVIPICLFR